MARAAAFTKEATSELTAISGRSYGRTMTCTDCETSADIEHCTECGKPVCPAHRTGSGALADGYQCIKRGCWEEPALTKALARHEALQRQVPPSAS